MLKIVPLRISIRDCFVLVLLVICNTIHVTDMASNTMYQNTDSKKDDELKKCPVTEDNMMQCSDLMYPCIFCINKTIDCSYGEPFDYKCEVKPQVVCNGSRTFNKRALCRFCYQTEKWEHRCEQKANCNSLDSPLKYYSTNCTVSDDVICLGNRKFLKKVRCSWTSGTRWSTALVLALTLGGFGADRFYLGHWQEGIGKLFSFGGLGVWTLVDALLIGIHHLGPADGSLFI